MCVLSCIWHLETPWTVAHQDSLSVEFSRQELWSGFPVPTPGESSWPRNRTWVFCISCIGRQIFYHCATWEEYTQHVSSFLLLTLTCKFYCWLIISIEKNCCGFEWLCKSLQICIWKFCNFYNSVFPNINVKLPMTIYLYIITPETKNILS